MSQIVYTELEALPLRWPYLQLEPLDVQTVNSWATDQTFNVSTSSTTYTPPDTGSPIEVAVYGPRKLGQVLLKKASASHELSTNLELYVRKVGNPGPLKMGVYEVIGSTTAYVDDVDEDRPYSGYSTSQQVTYTTRVAHTRNINEKIKLTAINIIFSTSVTWTVEIRTANSNGTPSSTILRTLNAPNNTWTSLDPPLELSPGLYSFVVYLSSGTGYASSGHYMGSFGTVHSDWVSTNSGSTWSSTSNWWRVFLKASTLRYETGNKLGEYSVPATAFGTTAAWTTLYHSQDIRRLLQTQDLYVVFSSPESPDANNCYMIQRGGSGRLYSGGVSNPNYLSDPSRKEISYFTDGSTSEYRYADVLIRKTYNEYMGVAYTFDKTYYLGPGSYGPLCRIQIKAVSGTVYALPVTISSAFATQQSSEKSTSSTTYTNLTWDVSGGAPEVKSATVEPITFLVRGNGAYNQVEFQPRIYYDNNPITPRNFGFTELYLMRLRSEAAGTLVRVNDKTNIYFASSGDMVTIDPNFRAPVKKLHVITGKVTADLLGVL